MKRLLLSLILLVSGLSIARADDPTQACTTCFSSYTEVATAGAMLYSSATITWTGITISSPAPNSLIAFYRSTSAAFTADIGTWTSIATDYLSPNQTASFIPFPYLHNSSYTYINKVGAAKVTYWYKCSPSTIQNLGLCGGTPDTPRAVSKN